jgi:hypothetical protein
MRTPMTDERREAALLKVRAVAHLISYCPELGQGCFPRNIARAMDLLASIERLLALEPQQELCFEQLAPYETNAS